MRTIDMATDWNSYVQVEILKLLKQIKIKPYRNYR